MRELISNMDIEIDPLGSDFPVQLHGSIEINVTALPIPIKIEESETDVKPDIENSVDNKDELMLLINQYQTAEVDKPMEVTEESKDFKLKKKKKKKRLKKLELKMLDSKKQKRQRRILNYKLPEEEPDGLPFYGCAVCDIKFKSLQALQYHVTEHKNRLTSWDLRVKNMKLRRQMRKEKKKLKKIKLENNIKEENLKMENDVELPVNISESVENLANNPQGLSNVISNTISIKNVPDNATNATVSKVIGNSCTSIENGELGNVNNDNFSVNNEKSFSKCEDSVNNGLDNSKQNNISQDGDPPVKGKEENVDDKDNINNIEQNLEKIFKCGVCSKQFSLGYYLKLHVRSHTGEKPYHCEVCGISFITASKLGRHRKRAHLSVKFECRICHRPYTRLEFLMRHFNKHHADDKIEGEPYDFNAILPYLKELEEELQKKKEEEALKKEELKLEEDPPITTTDTPITTTDTPITTTDTPITSKEPPSTIKDSADPWTVDFQDIKVEVKDEIKVEIDVPYYGDNDGDDFAGEPEPFKDEDNTDDEEYFPKDTWLPPMSPKVETTDLAPLKNTNKPSQGGTDSLHCDICDKTIRSHSYMRIHMRTHTGDKPYKCYVCNKGFITASKMNRHVMTHTDWENADKKDEKTEEDTKVKEEIDTEAVKDENDPDKPVKKKRGRKRKGLPNIKKEFPNEEKVNRKRKKRPHACEFCNKKFLYIEAMKIHLLSHNGEEKINKCHYCLEEFDNVPILKEHENCHIGPLPYLCTICGKNYKKRESMVYHRRMHESEKKYQCDVCPKSFNAQCKLQRHLLSHRPDKFVMRYECPVCAHIFNTKYHVEMHLATHEKEGVILQENRGQVIAMVLQNARKIPLESDRPTSLNNLMPTDERSRICNICGEIFNHFYYLEQHLKTHGSKFSIETTKEDVQEKKYICSVCNKGFKLSYYLKLHSFTHTKEKPFICQQCGKGFITKGKLKRHLETHAGLKKYQCHICCKFFTRPSYLRIHVRTIHGNQDYNFKSDMDYDIAMPLAHACMSVISHDSV